MSSYYCVPGDLIFMDNKGWIGFVIAVDDLNHLCYYNAISIYDDCIFYGHLFQALKSFMMCYRLI